MPQLPVSPRLPALAALCAVLALSGCGYNSIQGADEQVKAAWADVANQYQRRADLVPNLVATVKGYAAHERSTLEAVIQARSRAVAATGTPEEQAPVENTLVDGLKQVFALAEAYPDLRADQHFLDLQRELTATEDRIQAARRIYNGNVRDLNRRVEQVPSNLVAKLGGFDRADYFQIDAAATSVPSVA